MLTAIIVAAAAFLSWLTWKCKPSLSAHAVYLLVTLVLIFATVEDGRQKDRAFDDLPSKLVARLGYEALRNPPELPTQVKQPSSAVPLAPVSAPTTQTTTPAGVMLAASPEPVSALPPIGIYDPLTDCLIRTTSCPDGRDYADISAALNTKSGIDKITTSWAVFEDSPQDLLTFPGLVSCSATTLSCTSMEPAILTINSNSP